MQLDLKDADRLAAALAQAPDLAEREIRQAIGDALTALAPDLAAYPPVPAGSTYQRTGTLGDAWTAAEPTFQVISSGFEASLSNPTPYGPYVQDPQAQAPVHQDHGWPTTDEVAAARHPQIDQAAEAAADRIVRKLESAA